MIKELSSDEHSGLRSSEILVRWEEHGPNKLRGKKKKTNL
ncbi:MAG: cation-transporting P-type ATPase [Oscillospiraceae bacterium]|nr:cation-transporting P-type ATPase [Oscillospiraceae bacterium]